MSGLFRIFDTVLFSEFSLPELPSVSDEPHSITVKMGYGSPDQFKDLGFEVAFEWKNYNDLVVCWCERKGGEFLFVYPEEATFHINSNSNISCFLDEDSTPQMLRHLLLNQIIPRYLGTTGKLVLHAGAVTLANGKSVAFLGNSGFGKSTLISSFHHNGAQLINDDCILLECGQSGVTVIGGLVGIRLFPDSVDAVFSESAGFNHYTPYTDKQQLFLKDQEQAKQQQACVLDGMFILNDPEEEASDDISIQPVLGSEAMITMIYSAFSLDPSDRKMIVGNFKNVGATVAERLGVYKLHYPREHERLADVRAAVIDQVS